jgi:penicillin-binding protein 1C
MQVARLLEPREHRARRQNCGRSCALVFHTRSKTKFALYLTLALYGGTGRHPRGCAGVFRQGAAQLSLAEAALLVALLQSPEWCRPDCFRMRARCA